MYLLGVLVVAIGVGLSIALHELGHLLPAKLFGVKVKQYMVGFGPTLWSRRIGETECGIKAIPLGGYVRMIGMFPPKPGEDERQLRASSTGRFSQLADQARAEAMEEIEPGDEDRVFYKLPVWKKVIVMASGTVTNLVIAAVLLAGIFTLYGLPTGTPTLSAISPCAPHDMTTVAQDKTCGPALESPAKKAGLQPGDTVVRINGNPVSTWSETTKAIKSSGGTPLHLVVERDGTRRPVTVTPVVRDMPTYTADGKPIVDAQGNPVTASVGFLGATGSVENVPGPVSEAPGFVWDGLSQTASVFVHIPQKMVGVAQAAFSSDQRDPNGPISVVGVGRIAGEVTEGGAGGALDTIGAKFAFLVSLVASLNLALFVFNLIPLLPLDGGHVAGAIWEAIKRGWARLRRKPDPGYVDVAKALPVAYAMSTVLIVMSALLIYADLVNPVRVAG
ncbi:M50 family metallopeptidase [Segeticoccus rhizosphaerae]|jgi:membrane-associated protease RseP (regulator of RpoE activity)|uniref:M50 family metallopeptidase n=1 Tax=Segeticoccus rhizosphaerae TaxID=1104777 RepID=UPI0010C13021|nr:MULTISPECIES: site-2 protease family protein [Intrasporangiaceae]